MMTKQETEQPVFHFLLLRGRHRSGRKKDGTLQNFQPGDLIETTTDLAKLFGREKFRLITDEKGK